MQGGEVGTPFAVYWAGQSISVVTVSGEGMGKKTVILAACVLALWAATAAGVGEANAANAQKDMTGKDAFDSSQALRTLVTSTVVILVIGVGAMYLAKKVMPKVSAAMGKELRVVESISLGPRKHVYVVKVGTRKLLIGGANEAVTFLADVTEALGESQKHE
jgi:flagellar biogenesis protein FliO